MTPTTDQRRMARYMGWMPNQPETWDIGLLEHFMPIRLSPTGTR